MGTDAIFRIQSMTKIITSVTALRLVQEGCLELDDAVNVWLPELADRRVLVRPDGALDDTVPARRPITLRDLLTNQSGYGMILGDTPLARAMEANGTAAGPSPVALGAQAWLDALAQLPLAYQPGEGWRYHHSFSVLGILLGRIVGAPVHRHLAQALFDPLGMTDTGFWVPQDSRLERLPAAYRHTAGRLTETEPAGGGFYAGPPPFDVSHGELVSTIADFFTFLRGLLSGELLSDEHLELLRTDQINQSAKDRDSFFPGFWDSTGWGFGVGVATRGDHVGRFGWSGGLGTHFFVDPDGTIGILMAQVELDEQVMTVIDEFEELG